MTKTKNKTILLVEDNDSDVFLTERALRTSDIPYNLIVTRDGVEALDFLFNLKKEAPSLPDMVLLDLKLPRVDGLQVLKQIRSDTRTHKLPVMVMTSSSEEQDIAAVRELGATSYTAKPTDARRYIEIIRNLVTECMKA